MIVKINVSDGIGPFTARLCLAAAADYAEKHSLVIVGKRDETGKVVYWLERRRSHDHK